MAENGFSVVAHTADWALRIYGRDLAQLFRHAAEGMNSLLVGAETAVAPDVTRELTLAAHDAETLLVDWLSELAYWAETEQLIFPHVKLHAVTPTSLHATVNGGRAPELRKHIKAVTYHNLAIVETERGLETTIVFDV